MTTVNLDEATTDRLAKRARADGVSPQVLAAHVIEEWLERHPEDLEDMTQTIFKRNHGVFERLADL
jgi:hypothetical protein